MNARTLPALTGQIFHPIWIPTYLYLFLILHPGMLSMMLPAKYQLILLGVIFLSTAFFPLLVFFLMIRQKLIQSLRLESREERVYPILALAVFYYLTYYLLKEIPVMTLFNYFMLGTTLISIGILLLTFYTKPSLHMAAMGGVTGFLAGFMLISQKDLMLPIMATILLSGLVGTSRMILNAHKPGEIYLGYLTGMLIMFGLMWFI